MIACCSGEQVLLPKIYTPAERGSGITTEDLKHYCNDLLAAAAGSLDVYPLVLYLDRSGIHNEEMIKETFQEAGCQELTDVIKIPTASAKRLSPLDNSLFHIWKQRVLKSGPLDESNIIQRMSDAWNSITKEEIHAQYRRCGLMRNQDPYFDCPNPAEHKHAK
jgi:hypothetical protein